MRSVTVMLKRSLPILLIIAVTLVTLVRGDTIDAAKGVRILNETDDNVTIEFKPQDLKFDTLTVEHDTYLRADFFGASFEGMAGHPVVPVMKITVGVPEHGDFLHTVSTSGVRKISGLLVPQHGIEKVNATYRYTFIKNDSAYASMQPIPSELIKLSELKYFRDQRIVQITFQPVQFEAATKTILIYEHMTISLDFAHGRETEQSFERQHILDDELYKAIILNNSQARKWRRNRASATSNLLKAKDSFQGNEWYKIAIKDEGIYRITGKMLTDYGIDIKTIDPATIRIYNNGGTELSKNLNSADTDSLIENAIEVHDGRDGQFDVTDYIIFYGKATNNWRYNLTLNRLEHYLNHYENYNIYWLTWGGSKEGKRIHTQSMRDNSARPPETFFYGIYSFEQEIINVLGSGRDWYSRLFAPNDQFTFSANLPHALPDNSFLKFNFVGWTSSSHSFTVTVNGRLLETYSSYGIGDFSGQSMVDGFVTSGLNQLRILYQSNRATNHAYLDYFEIIYQRNFIADGDMLIYNIEPFMSQKRYQITGFSSNDLYLYDVTDFKDMMRYDEISATDKQISYYDEAGSTSPRRLIALAASAFKIPERVEKVALINLRRHDLSADFIIVTHEEFYDEALRLAAHRQQKDSLETMVVKVSNIYDEFSWGLFDPTAIRNFLRYAYQNWSYSPSYVLFFGDGDYDYNNIINDMDKNWIPTFQTTEKDENKNRTFDDWFVRVSGNDNIADMFIGRLPIRNAQQAKIVVEKIINYDLPQLIQQDDSVTRIDDWRNTVIMVADDELTEGGTGNETIHMVDAENIIEVNRYVPNHINKKKIYLTEYPALRNVSYFSALLKPAAMNDIIEEINNGALIINFIGHGNPTTWTHEYVLYEPRDFNKIQNGDKLSFWVAATCDFGRYDDPSQQGMAENLITSENRGAIGVLASSRPAFASNNAALNRAFYLNLFRKTGKTERLGQALFEAKLDVGNDENAEKYALLGDPTMRLSVPEYKAEITSIKPDTIRALSRINVKGFVSRDNKLWDDFNGKVLLKASDSKKKRLYTTESGTTVSYNLPGNLIFKGIGRVEYGRFDVTLIVPKDITYGGNLGRINLYFANESLHGNGYRDSLHVGGTAELYDADGPQIDISFNDQLFFEQGYTNQTPVLKVDIMDTLSGVNIVGDIGHHITMTLNGDQSNRVSLTDLFQYNENSYTRGTIYYDFLNYKSVDQSIIGLPEGRQQIEIKAWDNANNSNVASIEFTVLSSSNLEIRNVLNYPNPFSSNTVFTFWTNHDCMARVKIYTVSGRLIYTSDEFPLRMNELAKLRWDGCDDDGDPVANGVYFYKVSVKADLNGEEKTAEEIQKLVIIR